MATSPHLAQRIIDEFEYGDHPEFGLGLDDVIPSDPQEDETQAGEGVVLNQEAPPNNHPPYSRNNSCFFCYCLREYFSHSRHEKNVL